MWDIDPQQRPLATQASFPVLVSRLGCAGGETGEVLEPEVVEREDEVVVSFSVEPLPAGDYTCLGNRPVAHPVRLAAPLGDRRLLDGSCLSGKASTTSHCVAGAERWPSTDH